MRVVEIEVQDHQKRYVVIDEAGRLIEPIARYLKYLDRINAARQTLRSYALALRLYWEYISQQQIDWQQVTLDELSGFVLWLKLPSGSLKVVPAHPVPQARSNRTINHALTVVRSFYDYHWRLEEAVANVKGTTTTYLPARARRYKSFLHHITKGSPVEKNILKQKETRRLRPKTITKDQVQQLLDACGNQRDRLLVRLLYESAIRVGEALALWVQDVDLAENTLHICDRGPLENGAEIKTIYSPRVVMVSEDLIDEIVAYVGIAHTAEVETNHLFLKQHGERAGQALTYADVDSLFRRLRSRTGIAVTPHILRHTMLTALAEQGWAPELLQERAGHASFQQTYQTYVHPSREALRNAWEQSEEQVCLPERVESIHLNLVDGTSARVHTLQQTAEYEKDRWDVRNIPGCSYPPHCANYYIDFQRIPNVFRSLAKDYAKFQVAEGKSVKTLIRCAYCLSGFFVFWSVRYPDASTLHPLSLPDVEAFILHLKAEAATRRLKDMPQHIRHHLLFLEGLLCYFERSQHLARPSEPTTRIIWPSHYPRWDKRPSGKMKYIPQTVLTQLDTHLPHLSAASIPIVILLRASGWRISDVLYLKMDTCLEQESEKFWLVGDIQKTRILGHKIPITKEVAAVVLAQIEWVKQTYTPAENPQKWLFPASKRSKHSQRFQRGDPREATGFQTVLNDFAKKYHIQDENGEIFHFRLHAFRHTKGVELVNNGMSLVMVQQWMAHVSPEMTLIYARILDETMRTQWEKAVQNGIVQFNEGKPEYVPGKKMLVVINEPVTFDPERVRDYRANTKLPVGNCVKPPKLICKFTELPCFHCPAYVLTPEDLPALQSYEQQLLERIQIGVQANNSYWIEINQKNLEERVRPAIAMLKQGQTVAKGEKYEREYTPEEWEQRQRHNQEDAHE